MVMLKETKTKIENTFETKDIEIFLKVLDKSSKEKVGIPDLRAYIQKRINDKLKNK